MTFTVPEHRIAELRRALYVGMAASGSIPAQHLDEIVDLSVHAALTGLEACMRVALETSPDARVGISATGAALSILLSLVGDMLESVKSFGRHHGLVVEETKIQTGPLQ